MAWEYVCCDEVGSCDKFGVEICEDDIEGCIDVDCSEPRGFCINCNRPDTGEGASHDVEGRPDDCDGGSILLPLLSLPATRFVELVSLFT